MNRSIKVAVAAALATVLLAGVTYAAASRPVPQNQPQAVIQNTTAVSLPGNTAALEQALGTAAPGPVTYKVLVIDSTEGEDKTDYLDRVAGEWGQPGASTLLLVIYTQDNYDIRFYMGANFRANGVTVDEMLGYVRTLYLPKARVKDAAGGLADLVNTANVRMGGKQTALVKPMVTVADTCGDGPRQTAVCQLEVGQGLMTAYLNQFKTAPANDPDRLLDFKIDPNKVNVREASPSLEKIVFEITFSVQPAQGNAWMAGNGALGEGGWVVDKLLFVTAVKDGSVWRMAGMATSP